MKMKYPTLIMDKNSTLQFLAIITIGILLSTPSTAQGSIIVGSQAIRLDAFPGKYTETKLRVENNLDFEVVFVVARAEGNVQEIIGLENTRLPIPPGGEGDLPIKFYTLHKAEEKTYNGEIVITTGAIIKRIPLTVTVLSDEILFKAEMKVEPFTERVAPGDILSVVADIKNKGEGKIKVLIDINVKDPETGRLIATGNQSATISTLKSSVLKLQLPNDIKRKKYIIEGKLYPLKQGREAEEIASSTSEILVDIPVIETLTIFVADRLQPSRLKVFFSVILAVLIISPIIIHLKMEADRKKRYLESLDFTTLPRPSSKSAFLGKVAETTMRSYLPLDDLMTHTLIAGATGSGKTVAGQILVEEALQKDKAVIVLDPTAQWTGFIREAKSRGMLKLYPHFNMKKSQAKAFNGNIYVVNDPHKRIDITRYMKPGEVTIFCLSNLTSTQIDLFVENTVKNVFIANLDEVSHVRTLFVYDEVHRLLPKFGGSGRGFIYLERAAREFRKWGIGIILLSQVLSDFVGEIKANIGTEIQMRTRYEQDLKRIELKYDKDTMRSVVKESVGTGMLQNSGYNQGRPYFVSFRPLLHDHHKLSDEVLAQYTSFNLRLDDLYGSIQRFKMVGSDVFDFELEMSLAAENLKRGLFDVVELYLESLEPKVREYKSGLTEKQRKDIEALEQTDEKFIEKSRKIEAKIEGDVESLSLLKKDKSQEEKWRSALENERAKIEDELSEQRKEMELVMTRLEQIRKIVRDKEEVKHHLDSIRGSVEGDEDEQDSKKD